MADVLGGAFVASIFLGAPGAFAVALFMATAGQEFRLRRLRRRAQLADLRGRAKSRQRADARADGVAEGAFTGR